MTKMAVLLAGVAMLTQGSQAELSALLESGRSDLWISGSASNRPPWRDGDVEVKLFAVDVVPDDWLGLSRVGPGGWVPLHVERPAGWDWRGPASKLGSGDGRYQLAKYGEGAAFSAEWGSGFDANKNYVYSGVILRAKDGHLLMELGALERARADYGLTAKQNFLGMVDSKVFYFDLDDRDRLYFFERSDREHRWAVALNLEPLWPSSWKPDMAEQVFRGTRPGEVLVSVWAKNTAWFSMRPRRDFQGVPIDLKKAVPVAPGK